MWFLWKCFEASFCVFRSSKLQTNSFLTCFSLSVLWFTCIVNVFNAECGCMCAHTASANVCNVVLMRHSELQDGISVLDDSGTVVGTSRLAARHVCRTVPIRASLVLSSPVQLVSLVFVGRLSWLRCLTAGPAGNGTDPNAATHPHPPPPAARHDLPGEVRH